LGSRRLRETLRNEGQAINRKRVQRLMRQMGIAALKAARQAGARPKGPPLSATRTGEHA